MSYIIDIYKKKVEAQRNLFDLALYFTIFPQLIAGPIVRYNTIAFQLHVRTVTADKFSEGIRHFIIGLGKKVLIANQLGAIADEIFAMDPATMSVSTWKIYRNLFIVWALTGFWHGASWTFMILGYLLRMFNRFRKGWFRKIITKIMLADSTRIRYVFSDYWLGVLPR
ncbi:hypothetical protein BAWI5_02345 [Bacillus wiedmannii]